MPQAWRELRRSLALRVTGAPRPVGCEKDCLQAAQRAPPALIGTRREMTSSCPEAWQPPRACATAPQPPYDFHLCHLGGPAAQRRAAAEGRPAWGEGWAAAWTAVRLASPVAEASTTWAAAWAAAAEASLRRAGGGEA
eukprot:358413-Chlamydomonas_euryale.AAC.12